MRLRFAIPLAAIAPAVVVVLFLWARHLLTPTAALQAIALALLTAVVLCRGLLRDVFRFVGRMRGVARRLRPNGSEYPVEPDVADDFNQLAALFIALSEDVRRAFRKAHAERQEMEAVFSRMADGILVVDADLRLRRINPAAASLLALAPERALGATLIEATMHHALDRLFRQAISQGRTCASRIETIQPRRRLLQVLVTPIDSGDAGIGAVAVLQDLSEFERLERIRRDFVTNVSHELRTPVTGIKVMAESLVRGALKDPELAERFAHSIAESADRLVCLVDDVLVLARVEAGPSRREWKPVHLDDLVRDAARSLRPLADERQVKITLERVDEAVMVGDVETLRQAVTNLITNAVKYNRPGGDVRIRLEEGSSEIRLTVSDTGIGIAPEHLPRIFERFYRVDQGRSREVGGTGLGLAIVKHAAETHGGEVTVESTPGEGSVFTMVLPRSNPAEESGQPSPA
ncbi:MAG: ATP-binding protein [Armatimonadota bacterium]|nr:ATP-binding protein [Armatimonadota bacterium]